MSDRLDERQGSDNGPARASGGADWLRRCIALTLVVTPLLAATPVHAAPTETRSVEPGAFSAIETDIPAQIKVHIGNTARVRITAEPDVLKAIDVGVKNGTLVLVATGSFKTREPVAIDIQTPELEALAIRGSTEIQLEALQADRLQIAAAGSAVVVLNALELTRVGFDISDSASVEASGRADEQRLTIAGSGSFNGEALAADHADAQVTGAGEARLDVRKHLRAAVSDAGYLSYAGDPNVTPQVSGAGAIEPR